jgi:hypothetical protein
MWNGYLDGVEQRSGSREPSGADVAMMFVLYKAYRFAVAPDYRDNIADVFGYAQIAEECVGGAMIEARSAKEYQEKKETRKKSVDPLAYQAAMGKVYVPPVSETGPQQVSDTYVEHVIGLNGDETGEPAKIVSPTGALVRIYPDDPEYDRLREVFVRKVHSTGVDMPPGSSVEVHIDEVKSDE